MGLDGVRRSNYHPLKLITLLAQNRIVNYSAKLFVKTVTKLGVGGVDGVDATPHNRRIPKYKKRRMQIEGHFWHDHMHICRLCYHICTRSSEPKMIVKGSLLVLLLLLL